MKIPFDIKFIPQIKSGEYKVETRDGKTVVGLRRQILHGTPLLYGIIEELERCEMWKEDGTANPKMKKDNHDLFLITPEPELSEFEKKLSDVVGYAISLSVAEPQKPTSEFVKEYASELLDLAREELFANDAVLKEYAEVAREQGKAEALKDLPRWSPNNIYPELNDVVIGSIGTDNHFFIHRGRIIHLESLEKLPGFNE